GAGGYNPIPRINAAPSPQAASLLQAGGGGPGSGRTGDPPPLGPQMAAAREPAAAGQQGRPGVGRRQRLDGEPAGAARGAERRRDEPGGRFDVNVAVWAPGDDF